MRNWGEKIEELPSLFLCLILFQNCSGHTQKAKYCYRISAFEEEFAANIHRRLLNIYGQAAIDVNAVKWWGNRVDGNPREKGEIDLRLGSSLNWMISKHIYFYRG